VRAVAAILRELSRAARRDLGSFRSIQVNNFFLFVFLLIYGALESGVRPSSSYPFLALLGFLLLFPLSSDPLARVPASRLGLWPLSQAQRWALRVVSVTLSPVVWFAMAIAWKVRASLIAAVVGIALVGQAFGSAEKKLALGRRKLVSHHFRQMLSVLDTWIAILISLGGTVWRLTARDSDPDAFPILAMLVALALSTYTQCLFALDGPGGITRYRLLPMRGWQILWSKGGAWLVLLAILIAPLSLPSGLAFGLTALAIGHYPSTQLRLPLVRGRFAGGRVIFGVAQMVLGAMLGFGAAHRGPLFLLLAAAFYGASLYLCRNMRKL
jgi:hypothetical protein